MGLVSLGACVAGFVLDFIFGDPVWLYHPVRLIGKWISFLEKLLRRKTGEKKTDCCRRNLMDSDGCRGI
jgi:adenosylcobinamide-phosphate synthase